MGACYLKSANSETYGTVQGLRLLAHNAEWVNTCLLYRLTCSTVQERSVSKKRQNIKCVILIKRKQPKRDQQILVPPPSLCDIISSTSALSMLLAQRNIFEHRRRKRGAIFPYGGNCPLPAPGAIPDLVFHELYCPNQVTWLSKTFTFIAGVEFVQ